MADGAHERDGRKQRATHRRSRRRSQILAAACKVFSVKGYHAATVADILAEAHIARGTFYLYFPSKRDVFDALLEEMFSQITLTMRRIDTSAGAEPVLAQMYGNVRRVVDVLEGNRELTIILLREAVGLDADFDAKLTAFYDRICDLIDRVLRLGQQMGLVRPCDTSLVAYCVLGSLKEVVLRHLTGSRLVRERETLVAEILEYNLRGLFLPGRG